MTLSSPSRGRGCKYNSREIAYAKRGLESRFPLTKRKGQLRAVFFRFVKFEAEACTKRPQTPLPGVGGVNIVREK